MTTATAGGSTPVTGARGLVRRVLLTDAEIALLDALQPHCLPEHLLHPTQSPARSSATGAVHTGLDGPPDLDEEPPASDFADDFAADLVRSLLDRSLLTRRQEALTSVAVVAPLARSLTMLANPHATRVDLTVAGSPPTGPAAPGALGNPVGLRAWLALAGPAAVALVKVGEQAWELSAFLTADLATELQDLIPPPGVFGPAHPIAEALQTPRPTTVGQQTTQVHATDGPDGTHPPGPLPGDSPRALAITAAARATLRATVITTTPTGPGAGVLSWIGDEHHWWAVDADWRRWVRTGARQTLLTPILPEQTGHTLLAAVNRLLDAAHTLTPAADGGDRDVR